MNGFVSYFREAWEELKRVSWPTRDEIIQGTQTVLLFVLMMTALFGILDAVFSLAIGRGLLPLLSGQ
ncbi:MAG: preprotein translocase subunit SecE [Pleurocapsa sp. SU_196_0]|jgi:preprotein translocase subunit SecE|nr:preprotein translocase subunit SecE [Pleurocapsa sp. SU_196_0]